MPLAATLRFDDIYCYDAAFCLICASGKMFEGAALLFVMTARDRRWAVADAISFRARQRRGPRLMFRMSAALSVLRATMPGARKEEMPRRVARRRESARARRYRYEPRRLADCQYQPRHHRSRAARVRGLSFLLVER